MKTSRVSFHYKHYGLVHNMNITFWFSLWIFKIGFNINMKYWFPLCTLLLDFYYGHSSGTQTKRHSSHENREIVPDIFLCPSVWSRPQPIDVPVNGHHHHHHQKVAVVECRAHFRPSQLRPQSLMAPLVVLETVDNKKWNGYHLKRWTLKINREILKDFTDFKLKDVRSINLFSHPLQVDFKGKHRTAVIAEWNSSINGKVVFLSYHSPPRRFWL